MSHYVKPPECLKPEEREAPSRRTDRDASNMNPRSREMDHAVLRNNAYPNYNNTIKTTNAAMPGAGVGLSYEAVRGRGGVKENEGANATEVVSGGRSRDENRVTRWDEDDGVKCFPEQGGRESPAIEARMEAEEHKLDQQQALPECPEYLT